MPRFTGQNKKKINPRYFLNEVGLTEGEVRILEMMLEEGIVDEGFLGDIAAKSSNAIKSLALAAAILGGGALGPGGSAEAAPKAKVERMLIQGKMTDKQKLKLAKHDKWIKITLNDLNKHLTSKGNKGMQRRTRDLTLQIMGATSRDFPFGQEVTKEELVTYLTTGKAPGKKAQPKADSEDGSWGFADPLRKGLKYLDRDSPIGLDTGLFDK